MNDDTMGDILRRATERGMRDFKKDTEPHIIPKNTALPTNDAPRHTPLQVPFIDLAEIEAVLSTLPSEVEAVPLPKEIEELTASLRIVFAKTAHNCRSVAEKLRSIAQGLEDRASQLDRADKDVANHLEDWVCFERQSHETAKLYHKIPGYS